MAAAMDESAGRSWGPPRQTRRRGLRPSTVDKAARRSARHRQQGHGGVDEAIGLPGNGEDGLISAMGRAGQ